MPLALKLEKWIVVRRKLNIHQPEEDYLMERMSQSNAGHMVAELISNRMNHDSKMVLELVESLVPREQGMLSGSHMHTYMHTHTHTGMCNSRQADYDMVLHDSLSSKNT